MKELEIIQRFEDKFIEAAKLAIEMKESLNVRNKFNSGFEAIDVVTDVDLAVQEVVLKELSKSEDLKACELVAEEDTESRELFSKKSDLVITVDPVDGTRFYIDGKKFYSIVIGLHDKKRPLYTFLYYPEIGWGMKIVGNECRFFGQKPEIKTFYKLPEKTIVYNHYGPKGDPRVCAKELYEKLISEGYKFVNRIDVCDEAGTTAMFLVGLSEGYFGGDGSAVDCLVCYHYALANKLKIYEEIDISKVVSSAVVKGSQEYKGWYLVLR